MQTFEIYYSDLNEDAKVRLLQAVGAETAADMNWDMDLVPIATYDFEEDEKVTKKAKEISLDYEKYHLGEEMDYWIGMYTMIRISQSYDITHGYCVELYEYGYGSNGDGLVDVLTETKETLANGVEYLLGLV